MKLKGLSILNLAGALLLALGFISSCAQPDFVVEISNNDISVHNLKVQPVA